MEWMTWYDGLEKPTWTPSPSTIGLIWQLLYPIIVYHVYVRFSCRRFEGR